MKFPDFEDLPPQERREFLKLMGGLLALPLLPNATRDALREILFGPSAWAQTTGPINFLEINFRDQWDFGHLFVPPSVAQNYENVKSRIALYNTPIAERNGFYVTPQAAELRPHLDSIAVMELGECVLPGNESIHGHEAGNPLRSPGRSKASGAGRIDMGTVDKRPGGRAGGNEVLYSSSPTPLVLHNYYQKSITPGLRNGVILRSSIRSDVHTYYHFEASLANAQVDRFFDRNTFLNAFAQAPAPTPVTTSLQKHGALVAKLLKRVDEDYLKRTLASPVKQTQHAAKADALGGLFGNVPVPSARVELSAEEVNYWKNGIGDQVVCAGDDANNCVASGGKWHVGELFGYAFKLIQSGRVRSVGIDFDMHDIHTNRTPFVLYTQAQQSGLTLARLIQSLKNANLYDNTVIAMFTLDGSRSPISSSTGQDTKNAVVLAGGKIKGGYYGDIRVDNNGTVTYRRPDANGNPIAGGSTGRDQRVPAADVYRTVTQAAGIPDTLLNSFPDVKNGKVLSYMLR